MNTTPISTTNLRVFRDALALSDGTVSYLIDCTNYEIIRVVQREFSLWCFRNPIYENWIQAWKVFADVTE
jgi:hypothetical protein